jgi:uncharacterized protein YcfJ
MRKPLTIPLAVAAIMLATQAGAEITFYPGDDFHGRGFTVDREVSNLDKTGFNDRARSAIVNAGRWEACEDAYFRGRCVVLRPGSYDSLEGMGMSERISSIRPAGHHARFDEPQPLATPSYDYYQRPHERLYEANVTSVHAVGGPPEQRCWVERQQAVEPGGANIPGAVVGAVIGGVLGHQVGGGRGRDVATAGGAVAGAAIGANVGRGGTTYDRDVERCTNVSGFRPSYWDVTYQFQGVEHRVQLSAPPGPTISVNGNGEPRG